MLLYKLIDLYTYVVLAAVVISWIDLPRDNPVVKVLDALTEPLLKPIRNVLPASGGIDFSPLVLLLGLQFLGRLLR